MYVCIQLWILPSSAFLVIITLEQSRWYLETNRKPHKILSYRIIFLIKLFIHSLSKPLGLRFPSKRCDFTCFTFLNNYFSSVWFLVLQGKKHSKIVPGYKVLMLLFNLIGKEGILTVTSDLMNFCMDQPSNDVFNLHLLAVICKSKWTSAQNLQLTNLYKDFLGLE